MYRNSDSCVVNISYALLNTYHVFFISFIFLEINIQTCMFL